MIKTLIFDLDGTLLNTLDDLADAGNWVCQRNGWPEHSLEEYKQMVGNGIPKLVERFSPVWARDPQTLAGTQAQFKARYAAHKMDKTAPYHGMTAALKLLRNMGVRPAVFSNKADGLCKSIIAHYFGDTFFMVRGSLPNVPTKPDPTGLLDIMAQMGAAPETTLFVGDSNIDVQTAHNAGLKIVGVSWGFRGEEELRAAGADYIVDSPAALLALVQTENSIFSRL